jgi:PEP-CTERM motif
MGLNRLAAFSCVSLLLILVWAGPAQADGFSTGQFVTYTEGEWSSGGVAAPLLAADYDSVYQGTAGDLIVGVTGTPGQFFLELESSGAVLGFIPTSGQASALTTNLLDPTTSQTGVFGGDVVALALDVDFSKAGLLGTSSTPFGDLVLVNFGPASSPNSVNPFEELNGLTVNQFLATANTCLGGGPCQLGIDNTDQITLDLGAAFFEGSPSTFAEDHLVLPSSTTTPAPEPSSVALLAAGLLGILGLVKFKAKQLKSHAPSAQTLATPG